MARYIGPKCKSFLGVKVLIFLKKLPNSGIANAIWKLQSTARREGCQITAFSFRKNRRFVEFTAFLKNSSVTITKRLPG